MLLSLLALIVAVEIALGEPRGLEYFIANRLCAEGSRQQMGIAYGSSSQVFGGNVEEPPRHIARESVRSLVAGSKLRLWNIQSPRTSLSARFRLFENSAVRE